MKRSAILTRRPARESRADEFASWSPRPRQVAGGAGLVSLALELPAIAPESRATTKTQEEAAYLGRVAALGCCICRLMGHGFVAGHVHHIRTGQGMSQRAGHHLTLCVCEPHHQGPTGIHGDRSCLRVLKVTELDLLDMTIEQTAEVGTGLAVADAQGSIR